MSKFTITVPRINIGVFLSKHLKSVQNCYCVKLIETTNSNEKSIENLSFAIEWEDNEAKDAERQQLVQKIQKHLNTAMALEGGEDSSYDSECEDSDEASNSAHRSASRTPSDTLAAEFEEYVNVNPNFNGAKIELALKLGYSEKLGYAALKMLGPEPCDNEFLTELISLSANQPCSSEKKSEKSRSKTVQPTLRPIVIDGSNVAMSHGNKEVFSCRGIEICVDYFQSRGHKEITVFVPKWRKESARPDNRVVDREILDRLEKKRILVFTPSRYLQGKRLICYDDRYILKLASANDGVVVSNDNYKDLVKESSEFRRVVEERLLMYTFVNNHFMPPDDPLGRNGPTLDVFLRVPVTQPMSETICPYGRKCTYGNRCKYFHPERSGQSHRTVADRQPGKASKSNRNSNLQTLSLPPSASSASYSNDIPRAHSAAALGITSSEGTLRSDNPHRKLARQLSLLPSADPRLPGLLAATYDHRGHPMATRVSSAPVGPVRDDYESFLTLQETRRVMRLRLIGIFPEYQVDETMAAYPDETDARTMCAIILERYQGR